MLDRGTIALPSSDSALRIQPLLRWAGGKQNLLKTLLQYLPDNASGRVYREPFFGAGSLFFALQPRVAYLSDANHHLIDCYKYIRSSPLEVCRYLATHKRKTSEEYYYTVRDQYNRLSSSLPQAARFLYLNRTCFNGIFRVNTKGKFNVPYGWKEPPKIPGSNLVCGVSQALMNSELFAGEFDDALRDAKKHDFIYLDPPYPPLNETSFFAHYTKDRFSTMDQERLAETVKRLNRVGCSILLSNADTFAVRRLYQDFRCEKVRVRRYITCKARKHHVDELLITNYEVRHEAYN